MSATAAPVSELFGSKRETKEIARQGRRLDVTMLAGIGIALLAVAAGIGWTGVGFTYFFQPTGFFIVIVGTIGVTIITTPREALIQSARRVKDLFWPQDSLDREKLIEEIVSCARIWQTRGTLAIEPVAERASNLFLRDALLFALDVKDRGELESALENKLQLEERQGEADARVLEIAGGFAPTIGVMGTVVGLIAALRQFTNLSSVASGMGMAFVSTIYGLALANLVLLPAANRIRARVAETFEIEELITEGVLSLFDRIHPRQIRQRLACYRPESQTTERFMTAAAGAAAAGSAVRR